MRAQILKKYLYVVCILFLIGNNRASAEQLQAKADIIDCAGKSIGAVSFIENNDRSVKIELNIHSFMPGEHAFHIHEKPVCEAPDFKSAGGHFNPGGTEHGFLNRKGHHAGDLPNITVDEMGNCQASFTTALVTLKKDKNNSLLGQPGTSVVIHEMPDDYVTDPSGGGGKRIACGVIKILDKSE